MGFLISLTVIFANVGWMFAQAAGGSSTPQDLGGWLAVINIGIAGVGLIAFARGWIVAGYIHDQAIAREKAKQEEIEKLRANLDEVIQELIENRHVLTVDELTDKFMRLIEDDKLRKSSGPPSP